MNFVEQQVNLRSADKFGDLRPTDRGHTDLMPAPLTAFAATPVAVATTMGVVIA